MDTIEELERKLRIAKHEAACKEWSEYYEKIERFAKSIVGKCIMQWVSNGEFIVYKITHYNPMGYLGDRVTGRQWIELHSTDHIRVRVPNDRGDKWRIDTDNGHIYAHQFVYTTKHRGEDTLMNIAKIEFVNESIGNTCCSLIKKARTIGYFEGDKPVSPNYDNSLSRFTSFARVIPEEVYQELYEIYMERVQKTLSFWEKYGEVISNAPKLDSFVK